MFDNLLNWFLSLFSALRKLQSTINGILPREQQLGLIELILAAGKRTDLDSKQKSMGGLNKRLKIVGK